MVKHRYKISGVKQCEGIYIENISCVAEDIIDAINICRINGIKPHEVKRMEQVQPEMRRKLSFKNAINRGNYNE